MWVVALAVTMLGATSAPAMAVTAFDKGSLMFNSATPQTLTLSSDDGASVNGPVTLLTGARHGRGGPLHCHRQLHGRDEDSARDQATSVHPQRDVHRGSRGDRGSTADRQHHLRLESRAAAGQRAQGNRLPDPGLDRMQGEHDRADRIHDDGRVLPTQQVFDIKAGPEARHRSPSAA